MASDATILHADLDAFFASVVQRDHPPLRRRPVIVGSWVVLAASYEAKACGVRTAMSSARALRLCPQAIVLEPRMSAYAEVSKAVYRVFEDTTPIVEAMSIDEAFLDVRGLRRLSGSPVEIAVRLRRDVPERVGLPITVGVARATFLAKVASGVAKPDGLLVAPPERELAFLHPLPVERLWGVGPATARRLRDRGIRTVGEVALFPEPALVAIFGRASGRHLHALAHNRDPGPVQARRGHRSMGAQRALGRSPTSPRELDVALVALVDRVTRRMHAAGRVGRTVVLRLRFSDYSRATRSHTLPVATSREPCCSAATTGRPYRSSPAESRGRRRACLAESREMVSEARLEQTEHGLVPHGDGWFVLNAREASWRHREGRGLRCAFEGEPEFAQVGISLYVLAPGEPIGMYHWEADQEDFLVLDGEGLLIIEGEERPLRRWDLVHCPPGTRHIVVGGGDGPCVVLGLGARERSTGAGWGGYPVDEAALGHGAGVERETSDPEEAYARFPEPAPARYRDGSLPG